MAAPLLPKLPGESLLFVINFGPQLGTGESITGVTSVTADTGTPTGSALTISGQTFSATKAQFRALGGSNGSVYHIQATVTTSDSNIRVGCVQIRVESC